RLSKKMLESIIELVIKQVADRVQEKKVTVILDQSAKDWLTEKGYDQAFGARPLKRVVKRHVEEPLAEAILKAEVKEGDTVTFRRAKIRGKDELELQVGSSKPE